MKTPLTPLINLYKRLVVRAGKKYAVTTCLVGIVTIGSTAIGLHNNDDHFMNLKVLPKNISSKKLSQVMVDDFTDGLGVSCGFCHTEDKTSHKIDYASDANPQKNIARSMMKMTLKINKQYFGVKHPLIGDSVMVVNCMSCHRGTAFPYPAE
jgi:hypothetical protein